MRTYTITRTVYKYEELSDMAKEKVLMDLSDGNVDCDWWDSTYEDAATIGLNIIEFDLVRGRSCKGLWMMDALDMAEAIIKNHGDACETHKDAMAFLHDLAEAWMEHDEEGFEYGYDETSDFEGASEDFRQVILDDYWKILKEEYEYLTSEEAILETIEANDYEFTAEGRIDGGN